MTAPTELPKTREEAVTMIAGFDDSHLLNYYRGMAAMVKAQERQGKGDEAGPRYFRIMAEIARDELNRRAACVLTDEQISARFHSDEQLRDARDKADWAIREARKRRNSALVAEGQRLRTVVNDELERRRLMSGEAGQA